MRILAIGIAAFFVIIGVVFNNITAKENTIHNGNEVLSENTTNEPESVVQISSIPTVKIATPTPLPTITPTPTSVNETDYSISKFIYPNSKVVSSSLSAAILESEDNTDTITNWYKEVIKNQNMNVTSFVVTKTNNNVLNKLVGANSENEIRIEISKEYETEKVIINISI